MPLICTAHNRSGASLVGLQGNDLLQWAVDLQQQQWCRLFMPMQRSQPNVQIASTRPGYVLSCINDSADAYTAGNGMARVALTVLCYVRLSAIFHVNLGYRPQSDSKIFFSLIRRKSRSLLSLSELFRDSVHWTT